MEDLSEESFFPLQLNCTRWIIAIYSVLHLILVRPLVLLHSERLIKLNCSRFLALKEFAKTSPPSLPTHNLQGFRNFQCLSSFLQESCVRSGFVSFTSLTNLPNASENYLSCRTFLMSLSIAGSKYHAICSGDKANLLNRDVGKPKNRGIRIN